jgi:hypothetical protein
LDRYELLAYILRKPFKQEGHFFMQQAGDKPFKGRAVQGNRKADLIRAVGLKYPFQS